MIITKKIMLSLENINSNRLYKKLWFFYFSLVFVSGILVVGQFAQSARQLWEEISSQPIYLALLIGYVICDSIRLHFRRGPTISLGFPVIFLALFIGQQHGIPLVTLPIAVLGSLISESLYVTFSRQKYPISKTLQRVLFYTSHHAIACAGALIVHTFICAISTDCWFGLTTVHIQAALSYLVVYAGVSLILILPHDRQINLFFAHNEESLVRVDISNLLLLPIPTLAFLAYARTGIENIRQILLTASIMAPLFIIMFLLTRSFTKRDELAEREILNQKIDENLGTPTNMKSLAARTLKTIRVLLHYTNGAVYCAFGDTLELYAEGPKETKTLPASSDRKNAHLDTSPSTQIDWHWPRQLMYSKDIASIFTDENTYPIFRDHTLADGLESDLHLPKNTALLFLPIRKASSKSHEASELLVCILLTRPNKRFTLKDWDHGLGFRDKTRSLFHALHYQENRVRGLYRKVQHYTAKQDDSVKTAIEELISKEVEVDEILQVISEQSLYESPEIVLRSLINGEKSNALTISSGQLLKIYEQVRKKTAREVMPEAGDTLIKQLQIITSSLSPAFALGYQSPNPLSDPFFRNLSEALLAALEANTITRLSTLGSQLDRALAALNNIEETNQDHIEVSSTIALVTKELKHLREIIDLIKSYEDAGKAGDPLSQRNLLSEAITKLTEREQAIRNKFLDPEQFFLPQILNNWRKVLTTTLVDLPQSAAELKMNLRSTEALPLEETTVALVIENQGYGTAYRINAKLESSSDYDIIQGEYSSEAIRAQHVQEAEFIVHPKGNVNRLRLKFLITYNDSKKIGNVREWSEVLYLHQIPQKFTNIPNPYISGPPVKPGNPTFVGRQDIFHFIQQHANSSGDKKILVLIGERRTGKTSILQQLPSWLSKSRYIPVYIDCQGLGIDPGIANFFLGIATAISNSVEKAGIPCPRLKPQDLDQNPQYVFEHQFLPAVRSAIKERYLLLAIDEFERLGTLIKDKILPSGTFEYIRHLVQNGERLGFIFTGTHRMEELVGGYWSVLFNIARYRKVSFLKPDEALRLITEPVHSYGMIYDDLSIGEIFRLTACHPYYIQLLCSILVDRCNEEKRMYVTLQDVRKGVNEILEAGYAHLSFLWRESEPQTKFVLATLAELLQQHQNKVSTATIVARLAEYQVQLHPGTVMKIMDQQASREIVQKRSGYPTTYEFTAQLYAHWIRHYQPLSKVVEEIDKNTDER